MTARLTASDLKAIEARANAATSAPWYSAKYVPAPGEGEVHYRVQYQPDLPACRTFGDSLGDQEDAAFIAASRTDIPALLRDLRDARTALEIIASGPKNGFNSHIIAIARAALPPDERTET